MALCVKVVSGVLTADGEFSPDCLDYAVMTAAEYGQVPTLAALFAAPDAETVQQAFMAGLSLPLILWLSAWGFGVVVSWINDRSAQPTLEDD